MKMAKRILALALSMLIMIPSAQALQYSELSSFYKKTTDSYRTSIQSTLGTLRAQNYSAQAIANAVAQLKALDEQLGKVSEELSTVKLPTDQKGSFARRHAERQLDGVKESVSHLQHNVELEISDLQRMSDFNASYSPNIDPYAGMPDFGVPRPDPVAVSGSTSTAATANTAAFTTTQVAVAGVIAAGAITAIAVGASGGSTGGSSSTSHH